MAYRSQIDTLQAIRSKGQRPSGSVIVGDTSYSHAWAAKNGMFYVPAREIAENTDPFVGLFVLMRTHEPKRLRELAQRLSAAAAMVTVYDTNTRRSEHLVFEAGA